MRHITLLTSALCFLFLTDGSAQLPGMLQFSGSTNTETDSLDETSSGIEFQMPDSIRSESILLFSDRQWEPFIAPTRPFYNHTFRFSTGYSLNTMRLDNSMEHYNDTSEHSFNVVKHTPIFSFGHTYAFDSTFSLGFTLAYANSEIYFDNLYYGSQFFYVSLNPQLNIFRSYNFEYYVKLKVGLSYEKNELDMVPSERIRNIYPTGFHMFTGFTFAGLNYLINDNLALNMECSVWSPESVNLGVSYRFFKKKPDFSDANIKFAY